MKDDNYSASGVHDWPVAYNDLLPVLRSSWVTEGEIYLNRKLSGGRSGALVYLADITTSSFAGLAILKLDSAPDTEDEGGNEAYLHKQAIDDSPEFAQQHLPRVLNYLTENEQLALLSTVAGRRLEYAVPWMECSHDQQIRTLETVSSELLSKWNSDYRLDDAMHRPQHLLQSWLDYRLEPGNGGRIHDFLGNECGLPVDVPTFSCSGHWMPNPLYFAEGRTELPDRLLLRGAMGHCHGDFHGLNLLVDSRPDNEFNYFLIDLALYQSQQYLFFDHAYFELASLLRMRGGSSSQNWESVISHLCRFPSQDDPAPLRSDDIGLISMVNTLRNGVVSWIENNEGDRLAYMENQMLLARVAAGLNFSHKAISTELRQMGFHYAAANLKDYLKLNRVPWERSGPEFKLGSGTNESADSTGLAPPPAVSSVNFPVSGDTSGTETKSSVTASSPVEKSETEPGTITSFMYELRRRNVVRLAGLYIVVSWLCIQVIVALQPALNLPDWSTSLVAVLLAFGFTLVCAIAWAFELGDHGLQRTTRVSSRKNGQDRSKLAVDYTVMIGIIAIVLLTGREYVSFGFLNGVTGSQVGQVSQSGSQSAAETAQRPSIAVLPFSNLMADEDSSFCDGLTIEIITVLAQTGKFRIPGINSSFQYKNSGADPRQIGEVLNVDYLVEGSVRARGDAFRIEANLIRANDGFLIWSKTYVANKDNLFETQEQIGTSIGTALATPLNIDADILEARRTDNPEAYELFIRGLALLADRGQSLEEALNKLNQAVEMEPDFASAWGALSLVYDYIPTYLEYVNGNRVRAPAYYRMAKEAALHASEIDPDQPIVRHALGNMHLRDLQWGAAQVEYESALESDPFYDPVMLPYTGLLYTVGKRQEAQEMMHRAFNVDPLNNFYRFFNIYLDDYDRFGEEELDEIEFLFHQDPPIRTIALRVIINYYAAQGNLDEVLRLVDRCEDCSEELRTRVYDFIDDIKTLTPDGLFEKYKDYNFLGYRLLYTVGGADAALKAYEYNGLIAPRRLQFFTVPWSLVKEIGSEPQFVEISKELGLVTYWKRDGWPENCRPTEDGNFSCD